MKSTGHRMGIALCILFFSSFLVSCTLTSRVQSSGDCTEKIIGRWEGYFVSVVVPIDMWGPYRAISIAKIGDDFRVWWGFPTDRWLTPVPGARVENFGGCQWHIAFKDPWSEMYIDLNLIAENLMRGYYQYPTGRPNDFTLKRT